MSSRFYILLAPMLCLMILAGLLVEQSTHATADSVEPYHQAVRLAVDGIPWRLEGGTWAAQAVPLTEPALRLLRPNVHLSRRYAYTGADPSQDRLSGSLLVVQCRTVRDMLGHYPLNCYPANGWELVDEPVAAVRVIQSVRIPTVEYRFRRYDTLRIDTITVLNFLVVPGTGIFPDIQEVERAAEDYEQRYYGAAQFQVICNDALSLSEKERVADALISACLPAIRTMLSGGF